MKVRPVPKKMETTLQYDVTAFLSQAGALGCRQKKIRRLPHIFAKVLELPFNSDTDVSIEETPDSLKFVVSTNVLGDDVRAHTVDIYPGICKIVIGGDDASRDTCLGELELDRWRFRLPGSTRADLATAAYRYGELVVLVPKDFGEGLPDEYNNRSIAGGGTRQLLIVQ